MATRRDYVATRNQIALARSLAEENTWLIFGDSCEDAGEFQVPLSQELAWLVRAYYRFESLRRIGSPIPTEEAIQFAEFNEMFEMPDTVDLIRNEQIAGVVSERVGPFYTKLRTGLVLAENFNWLTDEPIRSLELFNLQAVDDLGLILRNVRMRWLSTIRLRFSRRVNPAHVAELVRGMTSTWYNCFELFIDGVEDRLKLIRSAFNMLRVIPQRGFLRGAKLYINGRAD